MATIDPTTLTVLLDSVASGKLIFDAGVGTTGAEANTVAKAAANDLVTLTAVLDNDVQADLAATFRARADGVLAASIYGALGAFNIWWALDKHVNTVGGLDGYLNTNNVRVSPALKDLGFALSPEQILPIAVDPMATFAVTGANSGTFVSVDNIDTSQYGRAWLAAVVTSTIGGSTITATVNGLQFDGQTPTNKQITIAAGSSVGTTVNVGVLGTQADSYDSITSIDITGGTAGNAFKIVSRVERVIPATA